MTQNAQTIRLENISVDYGRGPVVADLNLTVAAGEVLALLGQSGCGKSTTLRVVAGLLTPTAGRLWFGDQDVTYTPPWERGLGLVFQNHALFPHLTVLKNVEYGLRARRVPKSERRERAMNALALVKMSEFAQSLPGQISGGQSQRVSLARALVCEPKLLLLDEPFSSLDANLREQMRSEIGEIIRKVGVTVILVTHDQDEAMSMADRVAVMAGGRILEVDAPEVVYAKPRTAYTAKFVGASNLILGSHTRDSDGKWGFQTDGAAVLIPTAAPQDGSQYALCIKQEHVIPEGDTDFKYSAALESSSFHGTFRQLTWRLPALGGQLVRSRATPTSVARYAPGDVVEIGWNVADLAVVETAEGEEGLVAATPRPSAT